MRRAVLAAIGGVAWWLISCREIPAPEEGILSISEVILPSPGLVVNDTMRDSLGLVAPLRVNAFDIDGLPVSGAQAAFVALDSGAHFAGALMIGDDTVATWVVGNIAGLQTDSVLVPVTLVPQQIIAPPPATIRHVVTAQLTDTVATSPDLLTRVVNIQGATPRGIEAIIVSLPGRAGASGDPRAGRSHRDPAAGCDERGTRHDRPVGGAAIKARFRFLAIPTTRPTAR